MVPFCLRPFLFFTFLHLLNCSAQIALVVDLHFEPRALKCLTGGKSVGRVGFDHVQEQLLYFGCQVLLLLQLRLNYGLSAQNLVN